MKYMKMLGLVTVAALAFIALVGTTTASATVLCQKAGEGSPTGLTCASGKAYSGEVLAEAEEISRLTTAYKTIECKESTMKGTPTGEGKAIMEIPLSQFTLAGSCNCEIKVWSEGKLEITWIEGTHNGTVKSSGTEITTQCSTIFGSVHCIYVTSNTDFGTLTGGETAKLDISSANIPRLVTNPLCAEQALWHMKYKLSIPDALYVAGET